MKVIFGLLILFIALLNSGTFSSIEESKLEDYPANNEARPTNNELLAVLEGGGGGAGSQHRLCPHWVYGLSCAWFNGGTVVFNPQSQPANINLASGTMNQGSMNSGSWVCTSGNQMQLTWDKGGYIDNVTLSEINKETIKIDGSNQFGNRITARCNARWAGQIGPPHKRSCDIDRSRMPAEGACSIWLLKIDEQRRTLIIWPHWDRLPNKGKEIPKHWIPYTSGPCPDMLVRAKQDCRLWAPADY